MTRNCWTFLLFGLVMAVSLSSPAVAETFLVYNEGGIPSGAEDGRKHVLWTWCDAGQPCDVSESQACGTPEGSHSLRVNTNAWAGMGVFLNIDQNDSAPSSPHPTVDLSNFEGGDIRFWVKAPSSAVGAFNVKVEFQCEANGNIETRTTSIAANGWDGTTDWQEIVIPLADFPNPPGPTCLSAIVSPFMITIENLPFFNSFQVDNVRWHVANDHAGGSAVQVDGRQLMVEGAPFVVDGMAYAPISIGEDWHGSLRERADRYAVDFPLIAATGANAVRLYTSFLTTGMLDEAWSNGLYVIPTFDPDPVQLTCDEGKGYMRDRFREMVLEWKDHPAILLWLVGNEVNNNLGDADLCLDWYPQLDALALEAHTAEGASFHPVGTASAEIGDICVAGCSDDTSLPNVDFWGAQLYRGCSFGTAFSEYQKPDCARPLIITEFGADAYDSLLGAENQTMQANCLASLLDEADQALAVRTPRAVSSGQILFEWADEWWKAFAVDPELAGFCTSTDWSQHDTCKNWENFAYPDPAMNEEFWGITGLDAVDPDARNTRSANARVSESWRLGAVCSQEVVSYNAGSGDVAISFTPASGSSDHTVHYGPLADVSTYGYTGSASGLGATGSGTATIPAEGSLFWVVTSRKGVTEGCYGKDSAGEERPCASGVDNCSVAQAVHRDCQCDGS